MGSLFQNLLPSELGNLVGSVEETSGFRDVCVRRASPRGGAIAMMEVFAFVILAREDSLRMIRLRFRQQRVSLDLAV